MKYIYIVFFVYFNGSVKKTSPEEDVEMLRVIFELVENMIKSEEYDKDLQAELAAAFPNYLNVLQTSKRDLLRNDCGIVVTGMYKTTKYNKIHLVIQLYHSILFYLTRSTQKAVPNL